MTFSKVDIFIRFFPCLCEGKEGRSRKEGGKREERGREKGGKREGKGTHRGKGYVVRVGKNP